MTNLHSTIAATTCRRGHTARCARQRQVCRSGCRSSRPWAPHAARRADDRACSGSGPADECDLFGARQDCQGARRRRAHARRKPVRAAEIPPRQATFFDRPTAASRGGGRGRCRHSGQTEKSRQRNSTAGLPSTADVSGSHGHGRANGCQMPTSHLRHAIVDHMVPLPPRRCRDCRRWLSTPQHE
jgi:hypothetical protein